MGFGKYVLGGICAVGAVIAAPVVLPAAGLGIAGSALGATGAGFALGTGMMAASTGTVAATTIAAGTAGVAAGSAYEKKMEEVRAEGRRNGYVAASQEYEAKLRRQIESFRKQKGEWKIREDEYNELLIECENYIRELEEKNAAMEELFSIKDLYNELRNLPYCS